MLIKGLLDDGRRRRFDQLERLLKDMRSIADHKLVEVKRRRELLWWALANLARRQIE
mgnify:CR=1 FL=1